MSKILIIDDSKAMLKVLSDILMKNGHTPIVASDGEEGIEKAENVLPDIILLDIGLPDMDGFEVCKVLKESNLTKNIPVLFLTGHYPDASDAVKGLGLGAYDYIRKPFETNELLARIKVILKIRKQQEEITYLSVTDELTGLFNRRMLKYRLEESLAVVRRYESPLTCLMLDIDYFKKVNDTYGHLVGDFVLKELAHLLKQYTRTEDNLIRFGGEEFLIVLYEPMPKAYIIAERLRESIERHQFPLDKDTAKIVSITVSIGLSAYLEYVSDSQDTLIALADSALYLSKLNGRNKVTCIPYEKVTK